MRGGNQIQVLTALSPAVQWNHYREILLEEQQIRLEKRDQL